MRFSALTETGKVRENNEDSFHADGRIFIVADGMGGHRAGEVASAAAIREFLRFEGEHRDMDARRRLEEGMKAANLELYRMAASDPQLEGMGTTFTVALLEGDLYLGHVGDSRAYILRQGNLRLLTRDHSLVERMVEEGYISRSEARTHPKRNIILKALGVNEELEVDLQSLAVEAGDKILLCSDGLSGCVEDREIQAVVSGSGDPESCCRELVEAANEGGGTDNITVVSVFFDAGYPGGAARAKGRRGWWGAVFGGRSGG